MKLLGIDYGLAKIGLAIGDDSVKLAVPYKIIKETDLSKQVDLVEEVIKSEEIDLVVVGWPLSLQNQETAQTKQTAGFIDKLKKQNVEVVKEDERLSSKAAQQLGVKEDDAVAAMYILQSYLDRL